MILKHRDAPLVRFAWTSSAGSVIRCGVDANDYRAALLLFYEQNNLSAFKRIFLEQVTFAVNEYF